jgi:hypothetical protein
VRFALNEDEVGFRDAVRSLLADTCPPDAVRAAWGGEVGRHTGVGDAEPRRQGRVPAAWAGLAEMGVLGMVVPDALGGLGLDDEAVVPVLVECGRAALPDPVSSTAYVAASLLRDSLVLGEHAAAVGRAHLPGIVAGTTTAVVGFPGSALLPAARSAALFLMCLDDEVHLLVPDEVQLTPVESVDGARGLCRVQWDPTPGTAVLTGPDAVHAVNRAFGRQLPGGQAPPRRHVPGRGVRRTAGVAGRQLPGPRRGRRAGARVDGQGPGVRSGARGGHGMPAVPRGHRVHRRVRPAPLHEARLGAGRPLRRRRLPPPAHPARAARRRHRDALTS